MVVRSVQEWKDLFKKHDACGLSAAEFCKNEKLCTRYFSKRKKQLGWSVNKTIKPAKKKTDNDFIKVSLSKPKTNFSLEYEGLKLSCNELPPATWLSELVKSIK